MITLHYATGEGEFDVNPDYIAIVHIQGEGARLEIAIGSHGRHIFVSESRADIRALIREVRR